jgi:hypothetical protein
MITLYKSQIGFSLTRTALENDIEIRQIYPKRFTVFFRRTVFSSAVGWPAKAEHGRGFTEYLGWNLWTVEDSKSMATRLRKEVVNPGILLEAFCPYCINKLDCLCIDQHCAQCFPKIE